VEKFSQERLKKLAFLRECNPPVFRAKTASVKTCSASTTASNSTKVENTNNHSLRIMYIM
jgi:hypothetical protein